MKHRWPKLDADHTAFTREGAHKWAVVWTAYDDAFVSTRALDREVHDGVGQGFDLEGLLQLPAHGPEVGDPRSEIVRRQQALVLDVDGLLRGMQDAARWWCWSRWLSHLFKTHSVHRRTTKP
jgi:hypothetical protein